MRKVTRADAGACADITAQHFPAPDLVLTLVCTVCEHAYEPGLAAFGTGRTGCPRCGGWTWIARVGSGGGELGGGCA